MVVTTAFLHGELKEDSFMAIPHGRNAASRLVYHLRKSLYGLVREPININYIIGAASNVPEFPRRTTPEAIASFDGGIASFCATAK